MSFIRKIVLNKFAIKQLRGNLRLLSSAAGGNILNSGLPDVKLPDCTVDEFVFSNTDKWGNKIATECAITGRKYTYDELRRKSKNLNRALRKNFKLAKGDAVAIYSPNIPEYPIIALGALKAGLVVTTLNPLYTPEEISRQLIDSSAKALFTINALWKTAQEAVKLTKKQIPIIAINTENSAPTPNGAVSFREFADNEFDIEDVQSISSDSISFLPYSSGTTGLPKGVELTHKNITANLSQFLSESISTLEFATGDHQEVLPCILPMFHIYGLSISMLYGLYTGSKLITLPRFTPESYISMLSKHKPTVLLVAPPLVIFLNSHPDVKPEHLERVSYVMSGAAPLAASDEKMFLEKAQKPIFIYQGYGLTETSPGVTSGSKDIIQKFPCSGSIGKALPNTLLKIVPVDDPRGTALGPNQQGELLVKGPQVMKGYHNRPKETEEAFSDGWLRTGDVAYYDDNGLLYITDRAKELIKVKGFQVPPAELEGIIRAYPNVADVAVIGVPHPLYGEVPRAYVVPKAGKTVNPEEVSAYVESKVAKYKKLEGGVSIVDNIPKNPSGKILRRQLKAEYQAQN